jgi:hypothetical protein
MKKFFVFAISILSISMANAQSNDDGVKIGIKAGANFSNIIKSGDKDFETDYKTGFNAGVTLDIPVVPRLSFAPELVFSQKGYKAQTLLGDFTQTTSFIEAPILAKINVVDRFNIVAGPQVSFLVSTKNKFDSGFGTVEQEYEEDSDKFRKSLVGGVIGASFDISPNIDLHGRYALDFQKNNEDGTSQTPKFRNQVFQVGLGFKF